MSAVLPPLAWYQVHRPSSGTTPPRGVRTTATARTISSNAMTSETNRRNAAGRRTTMPVLSGWSRDGRSVMTSTGSGAAITVLPDAKRLKIVSFATVSATSTDRVSYSFVISPNEVSMSRVGINYSEIARPGRKSLLRSSSINLQQLTITVMVLNADRTYASSAQSQVDALEALANLDYDVSLFYSGVSPEKRWRITDIRFKSMRRNAANEVTIAEADLTFTEVMATPSVVPGMPTIKDLPASRNSVTNPGATDETQRGSDADRIKAIIDAGPAVTGPGTSGGGSVP